MPNTLPNEYQTQLEPFYETLPQDYDKISHQPADYEEFQSSLAASTTSNVPLLDQLKGPPTDYKFMETAIQEVGHTNNLYDVIQKEGNSADTVDTGEICDDNHVYFTLEPREP